jgi:hypothetical protein
MVVPELLYGSETSVNKRRDMSRTEAEKIRFLRTDMGNDTRDKMRN